MPAQDLQAVLSTSERLGWEYVHPGEPSPSPLLDSKPLLHEPTLVVPASDPPKPSGKGIAVLVVVSLFTLGSAGQAPYLLLIPLVVAGFVFGPTLMAAGDTDTSDWASRRQVARQRYDTDVAQWRQAIADHDQRERQRLDAMPVWHPILMSDATHRLDVVGGVPDGWRHLLVTLGMGMLARQEHVLLLDLTGQDVSVGSGLYEIAGSRYRRQRMSLPGSSHRLDLLADLPPDEVADLLADAVGSFRTERDEASFLRDADILQRAIKPLADNVSPQRILAALEILARTSSGSDLLSHDEIVRLADQVDLHGTGEVMQERLSLLRIAVELLATSDAGDAAEPMRPESILSRWNYDDLVIVQTNSAQRRRKDFVDQVLFHAVLQSMRRAAPTQQARALILVGADRLGETALEDMAAQASRLGVRLVVIFEHLRDETLRMVGTATSATAYMRLGNGPEATAAAEQIGREHRFKISQISRQLGKTTTVGGGTSTGLTETKGDALSVSNTRSGVLQGSSTQGTTFSSSVAESAQQMTNWSKATSITRGETEQLAYDFIVEKTELQTLPPTAFILVEGRFGRDRAVLGDCNVAIALADGVADGITTH